MIEKTNEYKTTTEEKNPVKIKTKQFIRIYFDDYKFTRQLILFKMVFAFYAKVS